MTKTITIEDKVINGDGTQTFIGDLAIVNDLGELHLGVRAQFTLPDTMTDQELIDWLKINDYEQYNYYP